MLRRFLVAILKTIAVAVALVTLGVCIASLITWFTRPSPSSAEGLLAKADHLAWNNDWAAAFPVYAKSQILFERRGDQGHALYAKVSQVPVVMESHDIRPLIAELNQDLNLPSAKRPEIRLRVLEMKARCEEEYDAGLAIETFKRVEELALKQHKLYLASRASGEVGILAFTLGNLEEATTRVKRAYAVAKYLGDPAAHIRLAGMIGLGLEQLGQPKQALVFLNEAIAEQKRHPDVAVPYVAINAKIDSLSDLRRYTEAMALADQALAKARARGYLGQLQSLLDSRSDALMRSGKVNDAIVGYREALGYAGRLSAWRAVTEIDGKLASAYERKGDLANALSAINDAINANQEAPEEMFLVPGNLAFKAKILAGMGRRAEAERLYAKDTEVTDMLLSEVPTPAMERLLLSQMGDLYSGYFRLVSDEGRFADAFRIIEQARGRIEAQQLEFDYTSVPKATDSGDLRLQKLELKILNAEGGHDSTAEISSEIGGSFSNWQAGTKEEEQAPLATVQKQLQKDELLVEYVLAEPNSYALVIGRSNVSRYVLPGKKQIEMDVGQYREGLLKRINESTLGKKIFHEVLGFTRNYPQSDSLILVADGELHLLPFGSLIDDSGHYLVEARVVSMTPSGTVLKLLRTKADPAAENRPYLGVAPWVQSRDVKPWVLRIRGAESGSTLLPPLPESRDEVESIAAMMPQPSTVLIGSQATKEKFESLPLRDYKILHLALHGIVDPVFPDRSSLVFAPSQRDDGRLEARDIRRLKLRANLVTLSACDTAVGPVSAAGVESLDTAFIEAGADAVVSTLWDLQDDYTDTFMKAFYRHLGRESKSAALRDAELDLLHAGLAPYYWASYELVGNPSGSPLRGSD